MSYVQQTKRLKDMTKQISRAVQVARIIKSDLKTLYPAIKFSTKSSSNCVDVYWNNGPKEKDVESHFGIYRYGGFRYGDFDGMRDTYEYSNVRKDIPQVQYIFFNRSFDELTLESAFNLVKGYDHKLVECKSLQSLLNNWGIAKNYIESRLHKMDLTNGFTFEAYRHELLK